MQKIIISRENESENDIKHYGVLGMKWGVHRAAKQYNSATTKTQKKQASDKLNSHMEKASKKLNKYYTKTNKQLDKSVRKRYGLFGSDKGYAKAKSKAERTAYKGNKWYKNMEKTFSKQSVVQLSDKDRSIGRDYAKFFEQKAGYMDSYYNYSTSHLAK